MFGYLLKRILLFIPTLFVISLLAFGLSKCTPGDPVDQVLPPEESNLRTGLVDKASYNKAYNEAARRLNLDKPLFYFSVSPLAYPDTLYRVLRKSERETLRKLVGQYGNWEQISAFKRQINSFDRRLALLPDSLRTNAYTVIWRNLQQLDLRYKDEAVVAKLKVIEKTISEDSLLNPVLLPFFMNLNDSYDRIKNESSRIKCYIPSFKWYGHKNQYHHWVVNFLTGDFGTSYRDGRPVSDKIWDAVRWTLLINGLAIFFAYLFSVPIGVRSAVHRGSRFDKASTLTLFILYSLPSFWVATLLMVFLTTPEYGMNFFPTMGLGEIPDGASFWQVFFIRGHHLVLPVFCLTYGALAFISRQMRGGMLNVLQQDYIRTAKAKGLSQKKIVWKHAFKNALFPIITLFASVFPAALAGSVVIEMIFNIPGMGRLTIDSIYTKDWPVVYSIVMMASILTMAGILISDILYAMIDPRVRYKKG